MKPIELIRIFSVTLALLSIVILTYVNNEIATRYNQADGKTQAMFGIVELLQFNYRYLVLIPATISIILVIKIFHAKESKTWEIVTLLLGLITIIGTLTSSWRLLT